MRRRHIDITVQTPATPEAVYALLTDGSTWPRWTPMDSVELEREGDPAPEGPGAIRVNTKGKTTGRDEILELEPNRRLKYASLSGLPVRDYIGEITLARGPGGTEINWHSSFFPKVPGTGWLLQRGIHKFLGECAQGLADYAPRSNLTRTDRAG
jgi:uncharacterized protein YndB with AHSA1/START domain